MVKNLLELQTTLKDSGILICFSGKFSQGIIQELGDALKKHMEYNEKPNKIIFNVFAIFIEQSQNIRNYTITKENLSNYNKISNSGILTIGELNSQYYISSGNLIENVDIDSLINKLELIRKMDKDALKRFYKEQLKKEYIEGSLGAGIGLIDIARKATTPIKYSIEKIDDTFSFFQLTVLV